MYFGVMLGAERAQVPRIIGAAVLDGDDVVDLGGRRSAHHARPAVAGEDLRAQLAPRSGRPVPKSAAGAIGA